MEFILAFLSIFFLGRGSYTEIEPSIASIEPSSFIQEASYHSATSNKDLPYYFIEPQNEPKGILIYMHGAGGGYEQGMSEELFAGNFKTLKEALKKNDFLYITPETTDFEMKGGKELVDLIFELKRQYGDLPVYLSGASAGGRTIFYAWQEVEKRNQLMSKDFFLKGIVFICPALSEKNVEAFDWNSKSTKVWIEVGEKDTVISLDLAESFRVKLENLGIKTELKNILGGSHNTPVEQIEWEKVLDYIK